MTHTPSGSYDFGDLLAPSETKEESKAPEQRRATVPSSGSPLDSLQKRRGENDSQSNFGSGVYSSFLNDIVGYNVDLDSSPARAHRQTRPVTGSSLMTTTPAQPQGEKPASELPTQPVAPTEEAKQSAKATTPASAPAAPAPAKEGNGLPPRPPTAPSNTSATAPAAAAATTPVPAAEPPSSAPPSHSSAPQQRQPSPATSAAPSTSANNNTATTTAAVPADNQNASTLNQWSSGTYDNTSQAYSMPGGFDPDEEDNSDDNNEQTDEDGEGEDSQPKRPRRRRSVRIIAPSEDGSQTDPFARGNRMNPPPNPPAQHAYNGQPNPNPQGAPYVNYTNNNNVYSNASGDVDNGNYFPNASPQYGAPLNGYAPGSNNNTNTPFMINNNASPQQQQYVAYAAAPPSFQQATQQQQWMAPSQQQQQQQQAHQAAPAPAPDGGAVPTPPQTGSPNLTNVITSPSSSPAGPSSVKPSPRLSAVERVPRDERMEKEEIKERENIAEERRRIDARRRRSKEATQDDDEEDFFSRLKKRVLSIDE